MCNNCNSKTWNGEWSGSVIIHPKVIWSENALPAQKEAEAIMAGRVCYTHNKPNIQGKRYGAILNPDGEYAVIDIDAKGIASWEKFDGKWILKYN